jgi:crossover junction endodeoxyribonuclease RusA
MKAALKPVPDPIAFTVPLLPPTVNHYVKHTRSGRHYESSEAIRFKEALSVFARGRSIRAEEYRVSVVIYLGKGDRGDVDNYLKCVLDGCVDAGVIHSDAAVRKLSIEKHRDWEQPRTEIHIEAY